MKVEKLTTNRVKFTFTITPEEFDHELDHVYEHIKPNVEIDGFRKGHVTRKMYEKKYGVESLYEEVLNHLLHHKYHEVLDTTDYEVVGDPKPIVNFDDVKVDNTFELALEFAIKPEVELGTYKGVEINKMEAVATDDEVDARINQLLKEEVTLEPKLEGSLENGDTAIFDFEGFKDGVPFEGGKSENFELEIGSGQFIPGFEEQMVGMNPGSEKEIKVTFPEQYHSEELAGKDATFMIKLHEIKKQVTPVLNDEWVSTLNRDEKTVEELKNAIKEEIVKEKESKNKNAALEMALDKIAETTKVDIPVEMIDYETNQQLKNMENQAKQYGLDFETYLSLTGMNEEELKAQMNVDSAKRVLNSLIIEAVAKVEKFEVSNDEIEGRFNEIAEMYQMEVSEVKKHLSPDLLKKDLEFGKALDFIYDNIKFI